MDVALCNLPIISVSTWLNSIFKELKIGSMLGSLVFNRWVDYTQIPFFQI